MDIHYIFKNLFKKFWARPQSQAETEKKSKELD